MVGHYSRSQLPQLGYDSLLEGILRIEVTRGFVNPYGVFLLIVTVPPCRLRLTNLNGRGL
jgi:hypothetical protein